VIKEEIRKKRGNVIFYYYFKKMLIEKCDTIFMKIKALKILSTMVFRKLCPKKFYQKQEWPVVAMFINGWELNVQSL
jgi:hypothetical protein